MAGKGRHAAAAAVATPYDRGRTDRDSGGSQATRIVGLTDELDFWHTPDHVPYVTILVAEHLEHWPIKSTTFRRWLSHMFYEMEAAAPNSTALASALEVIEGKALHEGKEHPVFTRVASVENYPLIYLDLCDDRWRATEISADGWRTLASHDVPIWFRRSRGMSALPQPEHGCSIDGLRDFLNVASDEDFALCVSWAVAALRHQGPYPILCLHGEQGAAKTTVARMLRALIDPNAAPVRAEPKDSRDLAISARNGWIIALDNLSSIRPWMSDALCRLSTGGGWVGRALYTDSEEVIFDAQRPILITGISEVATRGDLLDRSILLTLPAIPEEARAPEFELWARFNEASPRLLGALLDGVVSALRYERDVLLRQTPRMADFARWAVAAEKVYPWPDGTFLRAYRHNRRDSHEIALEASPVASEVRRLLHLLASGRERRRSCWRHWKRGLLVKRRT